jgi:hypothetical protein
MLFSPLLPGGSEGLELEELIIRPGAVTLVMAATASGCACPVCGQFSSRIHSRYIRTLTDPLY